jgi:hypothetical protein
MHLDMYFSSSAVNGKRLRRLGLSEVGTSNNSIISTLFEVPLFAFFNSASFFDSVWLGRAKSPMLSRFAFGDLLASQFSFTTLSAIFGLGSQRFQDRFCRKKEEKQVDNDDQRRHHDGLAVLMYRQAVADRQMSHLQLCLSDSTRSSLFRLSVLHHILLYWELSNERDLTSCYVSCL